MTIPRILVVEDDGDLSDMLDTLFRSLDYDVYTAAWGEEGLQIARDQPVNLVVLDIRLPDISGYDVCRQLRQQRRTHDIPIIFLTEKRDRVDKIQGLELGVVDYVTKPFDIQELQLRVRNALARAQQQSWIHRVTELPEGMLVDERLSSALSGESAWAVVAFELIGLDVFQERYGFVAGDDVLRAVTLMMRNAVRELGSEDDFIGHLDSNVFFILTDAASAESIGERVVMKMLLSREFFYPLQDRENDDGELIIAEEELLDLRAAIVDHATNGSANAESLRAHIFDRLATG